MDIRDPAEKQLLLLGQELTTLKITMQLLCSTKKTSLLAICPVILAPTVSQFLRRDNNKGSAQVTGSRVNRGADHGLEIPCIYRYNRSRA